MIFLPKINDIFNDISAKKIMIIITDLVQNIIKNIIIFWQKHH